MAVQDVKLADVKNYLRISETTPEDEIFLKQAMTVAKEYIRDYTGMEDINAKEAFMIPYYVLIQSMWDDRSLTVENGKVNPIVESVLRMHAVNLL